jgi:outer membrane protein insertion porin family
MHNRFLFIFFIFIICANKINAKVINNIEIIGNNRISSKTIIDYSGLMIGKNVNKYTLNNALKQIYRSGNFADVSIEDRKNKLIIKVLETPIIGDIFFVGSNKFSSDEAKKSLSTKSRQVYSKSRIKLDVEKLLVTFKKIGFLNVKIIPKAVFLDDNSVDIIFNIEEGEASHVSDIIFTGNKFFTSKKLNDSIISKKINSINVSQKSIFIDDNLENDIKIIESMYKNKGFAKASVETTIANFDKQKYNFTINYIIHEGKMYNFGKSEIITKIKTFENDKKLRKLITTKQGKKFSLRKINQTIAKITTYLKTKGFSNITPTYKLKFNDEKKIVNIEYNLNISKKTYINKIRISGNNKTKNNVILREMMIHEGDVYDKDKIDLSHDRVYMLGYFKNVEIKEDIIQDSDLVDLEIVVDEQFFGRINFSVGYSGYYGIVGNIALSINNFLGRGYGVNMSIDRSGFMESYNIGFYNPYMFGDKYNIGFGSNTVFSRFGDLGGGTSYISYLPYKGYSFSQSFNVSFEIINRLILTATASTSKFVYKMLGSFGYDLYQQLLGSRNAQTIGLSLMYNQMNRIRFATRGYTLQYSINLSGMGGLLPGQQFIQNNINATGNIPIFNDDLYLHVEASGGILNNMRKNTTIGMENLFSLGGYTRMRGFDFYGIGPRISKKGSDGTSNSMYYATEGSKFYYISAELRTPLFIPKDYGIYFSAFVDAGSVWGFAGGKQKSSYKSGNIDYEEVIQDSSKMRLSAGVAITWQSTMFGEIGFYYARPLIKQPYDTELQFGIKMGTSF